MAATGIGREGTDFDPLLTLVNSKTGLPYGLPGTYVVNLYRSGAVTPFVSGTLANTKLASVTNSPSTIKLAFLASDITAVGGTYITVEILRTDAGTDFIASFLVRMLAVGEALGNVGDGSISIQIGDVALLISQPDSAFYQLVIGSVATLAAGSSATASITGTGAIKTLNLGIPIGATGATGATGGGGTPTASSVAGMPNAITAVSNGLTTPSATPQYVYLTPASNSTGAVAIVFDAFASLAVKTPLGAALDANNTLVANIPYLLRVTSTDIRIQSSGASW